MTDVTSYDDEVGQVVVTRAQTVKEARLMKTLSVLCCIDKSLTTTNWLAEEQQDY